ncbi:MAG: hypothetical protein ISS23_00610 [Nanoarchaeota archaeon]|nr:hypothetical protein [Nanoarchaeota archaeon]
MKKAILVIDTTEELNKYSEKLVGPLEKMVSHSNAFYWDGERSAYGKVLEKVKEHARDIDCDAVVIKNKTSYTGWLLSHTSISVDLYKISN